MENKNLPTTKNNKNEQNDTKVDILALLGINIEDGKIEIDTNKTKNLIENLQKNIEAKSKEIEEGIKKKNLDLKDSVGVKIEEDKIELDLNKTKEFLDELSNKFKAFLGSIDGSINSMKR
jgi:hypothetical protein